MFEEKISSAELEQQNLFTNWPSPRYSDFENVVYSKLECRDAQIGSVTLACSISEGLGR